MTTSVVKMSAVRRELKEIQSRVSALIDIIDDHQGNIVYDLTLSPSLDGSINSVDEQQAKGDSSNHIEIETTGLCVCCLFFH